VRLPIEPPFLPMEMTQAAAIPHGSQWLYEPKWDGFRCLAFRDGEELYLQSKSGQPLTAYFPEVVESLKGLSASRFVLDGEIVVQRSDRDGFNALLQRIHPEPVNAPSCAQQTPARFVTFDLLVDDTGLDLTGWPLARRREALERFAGRYFGAEGGPVLSPVSTDYGTADAWLVDDTGALDGVVAKRRDLPYASGTRSAAVKVKNLRSADCVVGGYRLSAQGDGVASLLLGLYDANATLHYVGFTSGFKTRERSPLLDRLRAFERPPGFTGRAPGGENRWRAAKERWFPLEPKLVVEVQYDRMTGDRFRHGVRLLRWRPDKSPRGCTFEQLQRAKESRES
jgi:ATP-dependent DNA ligase